MAATHDAKVVEACIHGKEQRICGDRTCISAEREAAEVRGARWYVCQKTSQRWVLGETGQVLSKEHCRIRGRTERPFGAIRQGGFNQEHGPDPYALCVGQLLHGP